MINIVVVPMCPTSKCDTGILSRVDGYTVALEVRDDERNEIGWHCLGFLELDPFPAGHVSSMVYTSADNKLLLLRKVTGK